jgi:acetyltransferase-like isoleucine patch superfamily enzyme
LSHRLRLALATPLLGDEKAFTAASESIATVPGQLGVYTRQAFYRRTLAAVGDDVYFGFLSLFSKRGAQLGDRVYIGRMCTIGLATIGDDVMLADGVQVLSGRHQHGSGTGEGDALGATALGATGGLSASAVDACNGTGGQAASGARAATLRDNEQQFTRVTIGKGAWLGAGAIVMADVGEGAIVAAGAVVVKPVEAGARVGGVPARPL